MWVDRTVDLSGHLTVGVMADWMAGQKAVYLADQKAVRTVD